VLPEAAEAPNRTSSQTACKPSTRFAAAAESKRANLLALKIRLL
jgi:hypothetical protein